MDVKGEIKKAVTSVMNEVISEKHALFTPFQIPKEDNPVDVTKALTETIEEVISQTSSLSIYDSFMLVPAATVKAKADHAIKMK